MSFYRKKPVVIEAMQFVPSFKPDERDRFTGLHDPAWQAEARAVVAEADQIQNWMRSNGASFQCAHDAMGACILIDTPEGQMRANPGDWIIKGVKGEFCPIKSEIFSQTYEPAEGMPAEPDMSVATYEPATYEMAIYAGRGRLMDFGDAIRAMRDGERVCRGGWNGKGMWLKLVTPENYDVGVKIVGGLKMLPWIGMKTAGNEFVPWLASQTDMLAEDWDTLEGWKRRGYLTEPPK